MVPPPYRHRKDGIGGVLAVADNAVTCYWQSLYNAKPSCPPSRHNDCTQGSLGLPLAKYWSAKSYSVDVGVQQGILCKSMELSTLFSGKTAILRQSRVGKVRRPS